MLQDSSKFKRPLILVVDDEVQMVQMLRQDLENEGYGVAMATDAITARQMAVELKPDLIVVDVVMPGLDGVNMMESLRASPGIKNFPVIFMSGKAEKNVEHASNDPSKRYALMKKPIFLPEFNLLVRRFLSASHS